MANRPIQTPLPADLPQNWTQGQIVAPTGPEVGLSTQHGYNHQSKQINDAQKGINAINAAFDGLVPTSEKGQPNGVATLDGTGKVPTDQLPTMDYVPATRKVNGKSLSADITLTAEDVGAATKGYVDEKAAGLRVSATLTAGGWIGSGPYTQTLTVSGLGAAQNGDMGLAQNATGEQRAAARDAVISVTGQAAGTLTVTADGEKPGTDIPVAVTLLG